jgi:hypothetical protein
MAIDIFRNLAYGGVQLPPVPPTVGTTLTMQTGHSARFPAPPFTASIWPIGLPADPMNCELVRVTAISGEQWTIVRRAEGTNSRAIEINDQVAQAMTKATLDALIADPIAAAKTYTDSQIAANTSSDRAYIDAQIASARSYTDQRYTEAVNAGVSYTNQQVAANSTGDRNYTDQKVAAIVMPTWLGERVGYFPLGSLGAVYTPNVSSYDVHYLVIGGATTIANPTGTLAYETQPMIFRLRGNAGHAIAWGSQYYAGSYVPLPTVLPAGGRTLHVVFRVDIAQGIWWMIGMVQQP